MSRRTAIIEEFDDDTDLPLPSRPLPNTGARGALLQAIDDDDDFIGGSDEDISDSAASPPPRPTAGPASPSQHLFSGPQTRDRGPPTISDITPYKKWTCIYPIYIDAKRSYGTGSRRVARTKGVWWPLSKDIADATSRLGLSTLHEAQKSHPRDWENPGRVRVQWKKDGRLVNPRIKTKKQLLEMIAFHIQSVKPELIPKPPFTTGGATCTTDPSTPSAPKPSASNAKGKQPAKSKAASITTPASKLHTHTHNQLPTPPQPFPALANRVSQYSPSLPTGMLIDTVKAGMNAAEGAGGTPGQPGGAGAGGGKGKRKVLRVRG